MDRAALDSAGLEIDDWARARFPGGVIKQAVLLRYGDDPEPARLLPRRSTARPRPSSDEVVKGWRR